MLRRTLLAAAGAAAGTRKAPAQAGQVDVLLVLAVDVSRSIDEDEARLQREGYRNAVGDPRVVEVVRRGMIGAIGLAYVEWAGYEHQRLVLPWTRIADQRDADAWAWALAEAPRLRQAGTSISGAIDFSRQLLAEAPFEGGRRVIDVSADGSNNSGRRVDDARDEAVAAGITINGLPIMNDRGPPSRRSLPPLDEYFERRVVGGPGAFVLAAEDFSAFASSVRRKLIREIAGLSAPAA